MKIAHQEKDGIICFQIEGRLDAESAPEAEILVKGALKQGGQRLLFDMSKMDYISSAGLRSILMVAKKIESNEGKLTFANLRGMVQEVFTISGLNSIFQVNNHTAVAK